MMMMMMTMTITSTMTVMIIMCDFIKKKYNTVLRVAWNGDFHLIHRGTTGTSCRRLYFTLNGDECSQPKTIDTPIISNTKNVEILSPYYGKKMIRNVFAFLSSV